MIGDWPFTHDNLRPRFVLLLILTFALIAAMMLIDMALSSNLSRQERIERKNNHGDTTEETQNKRKRLGRVFVYAGWLPLISALLTAWAAPPIERVGPLLRNWNVVIGTVLLGMILWFEVWPRMYTTFPQVKRTRLALRIFKAVAIVNVALVILMIQRDLLMTRNLILICLVFLGGLTGYREFRRRFGSGDSTWASRLGGFTVVVQFLSFVLVVGAAIATFLTVLLLPIQWQQSFSALRVSPMARLNALWIGNLAVGVWLLSFYYGGFYLVRRTVRATGLSWFDPPHWRTLLPDLKYGKVPRLADTVRTAYIRWIIGVDAKTPHADVAQKVIQAARIQPLAGRKAVEGSPVRLTFSVIGDPGEGDNSQLSGRWGKKAEARQQAVDDVDFTILSSDIVYPAGELMDYERAVYRPYRHTHTPIYAIPGNHDWYNNLSGFLLNFGFSAAQSGHESLAQLIFRGVWGDRRRREVQNLREDYDVVALGGAPDLVETQQKLSFFELDFGNLNLSVLATDTGCMGSLDPLQYAWLEDRLKLARRNGRLIMVLLGEPLYVDGAFKAKGMHAQIYDMLRAYNVDVVMAGDTHSFQHYEVTYMGADNQPYTMHHIVNGGGGAYLSRPLDFNAQFACVEGRLAEGVEFQGDRVVLREWFPKMADMQKKFRPKQTKFEGIPPVVWFKRKREQFTDWYNQKILGTGFTNALEHDREPLLQSIVKVQMLQVGPDPSMCKLVLTPQFTRENLVLEDQPPIEIMPHQPRTVQNSSFASGHVPPTLPGLNGIESARPVR